MTRLLYVQGVPIWRNVVALRWALQIVSAVVVLSAIALFLLNVAREIEARDLPFGFTFLDRAAQIPIGEAIIPYQPSDSYLHGLVVAGLNTIRASILRELRGPACRFACHGRRFTNAFGGAREDALPCCRR